MSTDMSTDISTDMSDHVSGNIQTLFTPTAKCDKRKGTCRSLMIQLSAAGSSRTRQHVRPPLQRPARPLQRPARPLSSSCCSCSRPITTPLLHKCSADLMNL
ncbi:unnamed protein product [Pleuronectes platessa]|uniref:Uncharacterized protein n=1 Tax=Pleuronectes platessa TaxID=8262 RepID=A0A9N7U639_PLEPL|nr:unnamed protein product [Pleuronectes platessa]